MAKQRNGNNGTLRVAKDVSLTPPDQLAPDDAIALRLAVAEFERDSERAQAAATAAEASQQALRETANKIEAKYGRVKVDPKTGRILSREPDPDPVRKAVPAPPAPVAEAAND